MAETASVVVGDTVIFYSPRFSTINKSIVIISPIAAIITEIASKNDEMRRVSLTAFPPGEPPIPLTAIPHQRFSGQPSHDLDGYWQELKHG